MPVNFVPATSYNLHSVDHDRILLDDQVHDFRHLLDEESKPPMELKLEFSVGDQTYSSTLTRQRGPIAEGATVQLLGENGEITTRPAKESFAYYSEDRNYILSFIGKSRFDGLVYDTINEKLVHFTAENGVMNVDASAHEYFNFNGRNLKVVDYWSDCHGAQSLGLSEVRMGGVVGNVMYKSKGEDVSEDLVASWILESNTIYERQMDITLRMDSLVFVTSGNQVPFSASTCSMDISTQLTNFRYWSKPTNYPLWHLFDDCFGASGSTLGIAYVGTLCSTQANVGVSYDSKNINLVSYPTWATVAHEIGHNFNAQHSFEEGQGKTGGIMDYGPLPDKLINGEVQFNTKYRKTEVCQEVQAAYRGGCLITGVAPSPTTQSAAESACTGILCGSSGKAVRSLECVSHVHRAFPAVTRDSLALKRSGATLSECKTACANEGECNAFVFGRDGYCEIFAAMESTDMMFSTDYSTYFCADSEAPSGRVAEITLDDALATVLPSDLRNECCVDINHETWTGMNSWFKEDISQEECKNQCAQNSACEASTWDTLDNTCMFFGGVDFSKGLTNVAGMYSMSCDRTCAANIALGVESGSSSNADVATIAGAIGGTVSILSAIGGVVAWYKRRQARKANIAANADVEVCRTN